MIITNEHLAGWIFTNENAHIWYKKLCDLFPEYKDAYWMEKYIDQGIAGSIPEICLIAQKEMYNLYGYWCKDANINQLSRLVSSKINALVNLKKDSKVPHSYCCEQYLERQGVFRLIDVMHNNMIFTFSKEELLKQAKGNPIFVSGSFKTIEEKRTIKKVLLGLKVYIV
jgi:hypothetical protein